MPEYNCGLGRLVKYYHRVLYLFIHTLAQTHIHTHTQYKDNVTELTGSNKVPNVVNNIHAYRCATTAH